MDTTRKINNPIWRTLQSKVKLTGELQLLDEMAHNLWWTWNKDALDLFSELEADLWRKCKHISERLCCGVASIHKRICGIECIQSRPGYSQLGKRQLYVAAHLGHTDYLYPLITSPVIELICFNLMLYHRNIIYIRIFCIVY